MSSLEPERISAQQIVELLYEKAALTEERDKTPYQKGVLFAYETVLREAFGVRPIFVRTVS